MSYIKNKSINPFNINHLFFIICCFPWVSFSILPSDSQPWFTLLGVIVLISDKKIYIKKQIIYAIVVTSIGIIISISFNKNDNLLVLRNVYNFISFYIVLSVSYSLIKYRVNRETLLDIFKTCNYIYILFAFIQVVFPSLISFIIYYQIPSADRGLNSITPEPGFFGMYLIISSMVIICLDNFSIKRNFKIHIINIFSVIFLALSIMNFLYLFVFLLSFIFFKVLNLKIYKSYIFLLFPLIILTIGVIFYDNSLSNFRIYSLGKQIIQQPFGLVLGLIGDNSSFLRISDIIYPIQISFNNYLLPQGLSGTALKVGVYNFDSIFENNNTVIMSWLSSWILYLGFFGITSIAILFKPILKNLNSFKEYFFIYCFSLFSLTSIPLSFPFMPIIIAILLQDKIFYEENKKNSEFLLSK